MHWVACRRWLSTLCVTHDSSTTALRYTLSSHPRYRWETAVQHSSATSVRPRSSPRGHQDLA